MNLTYTNTITVKQYNGLRAAVGWNIYNEEQAARGLENSAFLIVVRDDDVPIGMARVITDYGYVVYIADVIIHPDYQGKGLGRSVMKKILEYVENSIEPGQGKSILLMAAKGKEEFYKKLGFRIRPNEDEGHGMHLNISK
jgi:GNAT superfamily N-acetyltransferase